MNSEELLFRQERDYAILFSNRSLRKAYLTNNEAEHFRKIYDASAASEARTEEVHLPVRLRQVFGTDRLHIIPVANGNSPPSLKGDMRAPISIFLEIASSCNLKCIHCFQCFHTQESKNQELTLPQLESIVDQCIEMGVFEFRLCGNEPTASSKFIPIVDKIVNSKRGIAVNTNGQVSQDTIRESINAGLRNFHFSLDGATSETNDSIRGRGTHARVLASVKEVVLNRGDATINMVLMKRNVKQLEEMASLCHSLSAKLTIFPLRLLGRGRQLRHETLSLVDIKIAHEQIATLKDRGYQVSGLFDFFYANKELNEQEQIGPRLTPCSGRTHLFIDCYGQAFPCDLLKEYGSYFNIGHVLENSIQSIWSDSSFNAFGAVVTSDKCSSCNYYQRECFSGCICETIMTNDVRDNYCFKDLM